MLWSLLSDLSSSGIFPRACKWFCHHVRNWYHTFGTAYDIWGESSQAVGATHHQRVPITFISRISEIILSLASWHLSVLHYLLRGHVQKAVLGTILTTKSLWMTLLLSIKPREPKNAAHCPAIKGSVANASGPNWRDRIRCMIWMTTCKSYFKACNVPQLRNLQANR